MRKTGESRALAWADWLGGRCIRPTFQNTRQAADVINRWYNAVRHIRSKRPRALSTRRTIRKPSEADRVLRCCRISHLPHERASFDAAAPAMYVEAYTISKQARSISTVTTTIPEPAPRQSMQKNSTYTAWRIPVGIAAAPYRGWILPSWRNSLLRVPAFPHI